MEAMILRAPGELVLDDVPPPRVGRDETLVQITNSGICGTDLKIYEGSIPVRHPLIMGHEMIGVVAEGADVRRGDRVIIDPSLFCRNCFHCRAGLNHLCPNGTLLGRDANGGFAEYLAVPPSHIFFLPDEIASHTAPLIQVVTTCLHAQRQIGIFPGESVVVLGLGVTGQMHVQLAKSRGANPVIGVARSAWKRELAEQLGADITLPAGAEALRDVLQATNGRGADVIIDSTGMIPVIAGGMRMARLGAKLLLFGITTATEGALPFYQLYFKELTLINSRAAKSEDYPASIELVRRGIIQLNPLVTHVMRLRELGTAIGMLKSDANQRMKIVLEHAWK